ncbi:hypothetical protein [Marinifilum fragile]|uniref:hypothetical protein n=1 Tax=Marinifilum fragile TaxID=570161 RepID=UPI001FE1D76A|nr:hypothetical protein [Marinifilum fragile]
MNVELSDKLNAYGDVQYRHISYDMDGTDDDLLPLVQEHKFDFFNLKWDCIIPLTIETQLMHHLV